MPFVSEAQRKKFLELEAKGEIPKGTYAKWEEETPKGRLPQRVGRSPKKTKVIK